MERWAGLTSNRVRATRWFEAWIGKMAQDTHAAAPSLPEAAGPRTGRVGQGPLLRVLIVGDSSAAGVGVASQSKALAGYLTRYLARRLKCTVSWRLVARTGLTTEQACDWLDEHCDSGECFDWAFVTLGVNDLIAGQEMDHVLRCRDRLVRSLCSDWGVKKVWFASLPPVHQLPCLPSPLRWVAGLKARRYDQALKMWCDTHSEVSYVSVNVSLPPELFARDGFHPREPIHRRCAQILAETAIQEVCTSPITKPAGSSGTGLGRPLSSMAT